jgi:hypothetical protein
VTDKELLDILVEIDTLAVEVTSWEADFIESILEKGIRTDKQREVIYKMIERYK